MSWLLQRGGIYFLYLCRKFPQNLFSKPSTGFGTTSTTSSGFGGGFSGFNTTTSKPSGGLFSGTTGGFGSNTTGYLSTISSQS